jgi:hypothetical protein
MIKKLLLITLFYLCFAQVLRAKPPRLAGFQKESANKRFVAKVYVNDNKGDEQLKHIESKFVVAVYEQESNRMLWRCGYKHTGYADGLLSDDGSTFVTICYRYSDVRPIVFVYQNGELKKKIFGKELPLNKRDMVPTSDGLIWRSVEPGASVSYNRKGSKFLLNINTVDGQIKVDLNTFQITK